MRINSFGTNGPCDCGAPDCSTCGPLLGYHYPPAWCYKCDEQLDEIEYSTGVCDSCKSRIIDDELFFDEEAL